MLIEFFGENFQSFRDEFHLSLIAAPRLDPNSDRGLVFVRLEGEDEPLELLRCAAIYGPNASGKSNLLRAAHALSYLLRSSSDTASDEQIACYEPFALDPASSERPTQLGLRLVHKGRVYEYVVLFDQWKIHREKLTHLGPDADTVLIDRVAQEVQGAWTEEDQFALIARSFRPNALLLSLVDKLAPEIADDLVVVIRRLLQHDDYSPMNWKPWQVRQMSVAHLAEEDSAGFGNWLRNWLRRADLGVIDFAVREFDVPSPDPANLAEANRRVKSRRQSKAPRHLQLTHRGASGETELPIVFESAGTIKFAELGPLLYRLQSEQRPFAAFVDEIGASLHPTLLVWIVEHLNCDMRPQDVRGQAVFTTHETQILDCEAKHGILRRDQLYLTEKDDSGASKLYSIAEFRERQNLNLRRRYLQGRYGGLPTPSRLGT